MTIKESVIKEWEDIQKTLDEGNGVVITEKSKLVLDTLAFLKMKEQDEKDPEIRITDIIVWTMAFVGLVCIIAKWFA